MRHFEYFSVLLVLLVMVLNVTMSTSAMEMVLINAMLLLHALILLVLIHVNVMKDLVVMVSSVLVWEVN